MMSYDTTTGAEKQADCSDVSSILWTFTPSSILTPVHYWMFTMIERIWKKSATKRDTEGYPGSCDRPAQGDIWRRDPKVFSGIISHCSIKIPMLKNNLRSNIAISKEQGDPDHFLTTFKDPDHFLKPNNSSLSCHVRGVDTLSWWTNNLLSHPVFLYRCALSWNAVRFCSAKCNTTYFSQSSQLKIIFNAANLMWRTSPII